MIGIIKTKPDEYLDKGPHWDNVSPWNRVSCCNGMGPEFMSKFNRKILSWLFDVLIDAVDIHDVDFTYSKKSKKAFHASNERLCKNMILLAKNEIPWWRWHKRRRFLKYWIPLFFELVESKSGWKAFKEAKPNEV